MGKRGALQKVREGVQKPPPGPSGVLPSELPLIEALPITGASRPFLHEEALPDGYVEREYAMSGVANYYDLVDAGNWDLKLRKSSGYRTRLLVRAPDATKFNGIVVVDWLNVTLQVDLDAEWIAQSQTLAQEGYAYVGVTVQRYGSENLVRWDPTRYAGMHIWDEGLSYEIYSQAGRVCRERSAEILEGLDVKHVIGVGASQSAWRLTTYLNAFHQRDHVFDGFLLRGRGYGGTPVRGDGIINGPRPAPIRSDIDVPVLTVQQEGDLIGLNSLYERQDDGPNFRLWEVAGGAHGGADMMARMLVRAESMGVTLPAVAVFVGRPTCIRTTSVDTMAYRALRRWVTTGEAPPTAPRIELTHAPGKPRAIWRTIDDSMIARDEHGNAKGGIRLPDIEVPLARWYGATKRNRLGGADEAFDLAKVRSLYSTHDDYVAKIEESVEQLVTAGFISQEAAEDFIDEAKASCVPDSLPDWLAYPIDPAKAGASK
jgi:hypothetical protein